MTKYIIQVSQNNRLEIIGLHIELHKGEINALSNHISIIIQLVINL